MTQDNSSRANSFILLPNPAYVPDNPEAPDQDPHILIRYDDFVRQLFKADTEPMMALHAALGVAGEAGELADAIKKEYIYGKPRNRENVVEELGDLRFFIQAVMNHYGITESEVLQENGNKLAKRYNGLRYSGEAAIARADKVVGRDE